MGVLGSAPALGDRVAYVIIKGIKGNLMSEDAGQVDSDIHSRCRGIREV